MNKYEVIAEFITEDSVIKFTDGTEFNGSKAVSSAIVQCCESYNDGYMSGFGKFIVKSGLVTIGVGLITYGTVKMVKKIKNSKEQPKELKVEETEAE